MMENTEYGEDEVLIEDSIIYSLQSRIHQNKFLYSSDNAKKKEFSDLKAQFDLSYDIQMPHSNDILTFGLNGSITEKNDKLHEYNYIELNDDDSHSVNNVYHYGNNKNTNRGLMLNVSYKYIINKWSGLMFSYRHENMSFDEKKKHFTANIFGDDEIVNDLIQRSELMHDDVNSYKMHERESTDQLFMSYRYDKSSERYHTLLNFELPINAVMKRMEYHSAVDTAFRRKVFAPDIKMELVWTTQSRQHNSSKSLSFGYNLKHQMPDMLSLIDRTDSSDPMYIFKGNTHLKNKRIHTFSGSISLTPHRFSLHTISIGYSIEENSVFNAASYNKKKGRTVIMPQNTRGNSSINLTMMNHENISKDRSWAISHMITFKWNKFFGFTGEDENVAQTAYKVNDLILAERLGTSKSLANTKCQVNGNVYLTYKHTASSLTSYMTSNTFDYGIRLNTTIELPWNIRLSSTLSSVSRRKYNVESMNTDRLLLSASVIKSFGESLTIDFSADDILNQRTNVYSFVNMQGRTETFFNNLRRYVMLHVVWRINQKIKL